VKWVDESMEKGMTERDYDMVLFTTGTGRLLHPRRMWRFLVCMCTWGKFMLHLRQFVVSTYLYGAVCQPKSVITINQIARWL